MQPEYLNRLSAHVRAFVLDVERKAGIAIEVALHERLNAGGPMGHGKLEVVIEGTRVRLNTPTNDYFPDGAVYHEVLHIQRLLVDRVPRIALADAVDYNQEFEMALVEVDNAIEHLFIVPIELQEYPERRQHWEGAMRRVWEQDLQHAETELDRRAFACLHWTFLLHVLPNSPTKAVAKTFMQNYEGLLETADAFADQAISLLADKPLLIRLFFHQFPELPRHMAALEFMGGGFATRQEPIEGP